MTSVLRVSRLKKPAPKLRQTGADCSLGKTTWQHRWGAVFRFCCGTSWGQEEQLRAEKEAALLTQEVALCSNRLCDISCAAAPVQVRVLRAKVAEAEEEQLRAEEEAAQLRQEVALQQQARGSLQDSSSGCGHDRAAEEGLRNAQLEAQAAKAEAVRLQRDVATLQQQVQQQQQVLQEYHSHPAQSSAGGGESQLASELRAGQEQLRTLRQALSAAEAQAAAAKAETAAARAEADAAKKAAAAAAAASAGTVSGAVPASAAAPVAGGVAGVSGMSADDDVEALQEQVELLTHKVVTLKKSRDKLLEQLDGQSVEMEQLLADNQVSYCWHQQDSDMPRTACAFCVSTRKGSGNAHMCHC